MPLGALRAFLLQRLLQMKQVALNRLPPSLAQEFEGSREQPADLGQGFRVCERWGEFQSDSPLHK
jgi:hypothetical protein